MKKNSPIAILKKYAKFYKTKEKYVTHMIKLDLIVGSTQRMTELTLEAYWFYFRELNPLERDMRDIRNFVYSYAIKHQ